MAWHRALAAATSSSRALARSDIARNGKRTIRISSPLVRVQTRGLAKRSAAGKGKGPRGEKSGKGPHGKKSAISRAIAGSASAGEEGAPTLVFGMRPVDYSVLPPMRRSPPAPPPKPGMGKYLYPLTLLFTASTVGYFYVNNKNDNYAYWEAMQGGEALRMDDDDDDDDEWDEDEEEERGERLDQLQQVMNVARDAGGGDVDADNAKLNQRRGWFGWIKGWRRGKDVSDSSEK